MLLPGTDAPTAAAIAERVRTAVEDMAVPGPGGLLNCTVSIGYANLVANTDWEALIGAADQALYCAKGRGRNRVEGPADDRAATLWR